MESCYVCKRAKSNQKNPYICNSCSKLGYIENKCSPIGFFDFVCWKPFVKLPLGNLINMQREIKFRVFIPTTNEIGGKFEYPTDISLWNNKDLQQYTGLKDKNNKEICEGKTTIIDWKTGSKFETENRWGRFLLPPFHDLPDNELHRYSLQK